MSPLGYSSYPTCFDLSMTGLFSFSLVSFIGMETMHAYLTKHAYPTLLLFPLVLVPLIHILKRWSEEKAVSF